MGEAKRLFEQIRFAPKKLQSKYERLTMLNALAKKVSATASAIGRVSGGESGASRVEQNVEKIIALEVEIMDDIERYTELLHIANAILDALALSNDKYCLCLERYYCLCENFEELADVLGYSVRGVIRLRDKALQAADLIMAEQKISL